MADPEVEARLAETNPKLEPAMRRVTEVVLGADPRISVYVNFGIVTFAYEGELAAFVQPKGKTISLMFNRGARIPGEFPHLEGDWPTARFMRFADLAEVDA